MPTLSTLLSLNALGFAVAAPLALLEWQGNPFPARPGRCSFPKDTEE